MNRFKLIISLIFLSLFFVTGTAFAKTKILIIPIENGGYSNNFEQLKAYNTIIYKELLNSGVFYPLRSKDSNLALNSVKPRQTRFKNQSNLGKRAFFASQTKSIADRYGVEYLLHSNVLKYDGYTISKSSKNAKADYPTVSGTIGVSLIRAKDASVVWYYESIASVNTSYFQLSNGLYGGRGDVDNDLYYSLLEKICKNIARNIRR